MVLQSEHWVDLGAVRRVLLAEDKIVGVACMVLPRGRSRLSLHFRACVDL